MGTEPTDLGLNKGLSLQWLSAGLGFMRPKTMANT